jgi:hypothetical protein
MVGILMKAGELPEAESTVRCHWHQLILNSCPSMPRYSLFDNIVYSIDNQSISKLLCRLMTYIMLNAGWSLLSVLAD